MTDSLTLGRFGIFNRGRFHLFPDEQRIALCGISSGLSMCVASVGTAEQAGGICRRCLRKMGDDDHGPGCDGPYNCTCGAVQ